MRRVLLALAVLTACSKGDKPPEPTSGRPNAKPETGPSQRGGGGGGGAVEGGGGAPDAKTQAKQMFMTVCATCHGVDGTGSGPVAESLDPKPRNYTDAAWQASVKDDDLRAIILGGGASVGKSAMMPAQHQLKDRPEVVDELIVIIRAFAKQP